MKPAKPDPSQGRGKKLGHTKEKPDRGQSDSEEVGEGGERPQNHGWFVSQVAKDKSLSGRDHGKAVSDVAHSDQGKPAKSEP